MSAEVTCPSCQHTLHVAPGSAGPWLTCPRCRAPLAQGAIQSAQPGVQAQAPGALPLSLISCPHCGRTVPELCLFCPHCKEPIRGLDGWDGVGGTGKGAGNPP